MGEEEYINRCVLCEGGADTTIVYKGKGELESEWAICYTCKDEYESGRLKKRYKERLKNVKLPDWFSEK